MNQQGQSGTQAARGRRYSPAVRAEILRVADDLRVAKAAERYGCAPWTIYDWRKKEARRGEQAGLEPLKSDTGDVSDAERDERHELILTIWRPR